MKNQDRRATIAGAILGALCAVLVLAIHGSASESRAYTEGFHQVYPLAAGGRVSLENVNGPVHISAWDRNEVKVDAVKYAGSKERLNQARIEISSGPDYVSIRTRYPDHDLTFSDDDWHNNQPEWNTR